jgi:acyl-CoA thioester hydrolase
MTDLPKLEDFPHKESDKLRYGDMDALGHINNAVYTTFLETGRAALLSHPGINAWGNEHFTFVIARLEVDYRREVRWPGIVQIGTAVKSVGNSSMVLQQALFHEGVCVVTAQSVMVQVDVAAHRPAPIGEATRAVLQGFRLRENV